MDQDWPGSTRERIAALLRMAEALEQTARDMRIKAAELSPGRSIVVSTDEYQRYLEGVLDPRD